MSQPKPSTESSNYADALPEAAATPPTTNYEYSSSAGLDVPLYQTMKEHAN